MFCPGHYHAIWSIILYWIHDNDTKFTSWILTLLVVSRACFLFMAQQTLSQWEELLLVPCRAWKISGIAIRIFHIAFVFFGVKCWFMFCPGHYHAIWSIILYWIHDNDTKFTSWILTLLVVSRACFLSMAKQTLSQWVEVLRVPCWAWKISGIGIRRNFSSCICMMIIGPFEEQTGLWPQTGSSHWVRRVHFWCHDTLD